MGWEPEGDVEVYTGDDLPVYGGGACDAEGYVYTYATGCTKPETVQAYADANEKTIIGDLGELDPQRIIDRERIKQAVIEANPYLAIESVDSFTDKFLAATDILSPQDRNIVLSSFEASLRNNPRHLLDEMPTILDMFELLESDEKVKRLEATQKVISISGAQESLCRENSTGNGCRVTGIDFDIPTMAEINLQAYGPVVLEAAIHIGLLIIACRSGGCTRPIPMEPVNMPRSSGHVSPAPSTTPVVTAQARVNGSNFRDVNQTARVGGDVNTPTLIAERISVKSQISGKPLPNGNKATAHAEVGAMQKAFEAGATKGADMTLTVNGQAVCGYCRGDVAAMAEASGLRSLTVIEQATGNTLYWNPGMRTLKVR